MRPDPLTQLAFALHENPGVFALVIGSGLSRAAAIPTGWEITLDLVRRVALAQGASEQDDWAAWYRQTHGEEPNYSTLLEQLAATPAERRAILDGYIEPTSAERDDGKKMPTAAHRAIARLVRDGVIRVLITTNFDRLMENALRDEGVEPTVVGSVDALAGAVPLTHSACFLLKLHGDYKDARSLNTEAELAAYPDEYDTLLDRIFDEYGLIVCGWSGEWDHALRAAMLRAPNRRYSWYWAARGGLGTGAQALVAHRRGTVIPIEEADRFFSDVAQRVATLQQADAPDPVSTQFLIGSAKRFVVRPEFRVQLEDLVLGQVQRVCSLIAESAKVNPGNWDPTVFRHQAERYEQATEALATICGVVGRWGDGASASLAIDALRSVHAAAKRFNLSGHPYVRLHLYPAVLVMMAYGLALTRAKRWAELHALLTLVIDRDGREPVRVVDALFSVCWDSAETFKAFPGLEKARLPLSERLLQLMGSWGGAFMGAMPDLAQEYERFEILASLAHAGRLTREQLESGMGNPGAWVAVGRSALDRRVAGPILDELSMTAWQAQVTEAGFGEKAFIDTFVNSFRLIQGRI